MVGCVCDGSRRREDGERIFAYQQRLFAFVVLKPVHLIHGFCQGAGKTIAFVRQYGTVEAGDQHRDSGRLHCLKCGKDALQNVPDFAQRRLLVVECIQKPEDDREAGVDGLQKGRKEMSDRLLHLIASEAS